MHRLKQRPAIIVLALCTLGIFAIASAAENRAALLIGNAKYADSDRSLKAPINDIRDLTLELGSDGFDVENGENLTGAAMRLALERFYAKIGPDTVALLFFSGYALQSDKDNFLIPTDASIWSEVEARQVGFSLREILGQIDKRGGTKIVVLDASRQNPFERRIREPPIGLTAFALPIDTLLIYSTAVDSVVRDAEGEHSLFVDALLKNIADPNQMAEESFGRTRVQVERATKRLHIPFISSSLMKDFSFKSASVRKGVGSNIPSRN